MQSVTVLYEGKRVIQNSYKRKINKRYSSIPNENTAGNEACVAVLKKNTQ